MRAAFFQAVTLCGKFTAAAVAAMFFTACSGEAPQSAMQNKYLSLSAPEAKVPDYQLAACESLWDVANKQAASNPLYWLRAIDCASRLSPAEARAQARRGATDDWASAFRQGVLLANGNVTPIERRQYMLQLDAYSAEVPQPVRALAQLWRDNQMAQLQLSAERTRYYHLQQSSDAQLDVLRQQQAELNSELKLTRRKLDTLTDIERQLSSRRSSDSADGSHTEKSDQPESESPRPSEEATKP